MNKLKLYILLTIVSAGGCQPKVTPSIKDMLAKVWKANTVKEADVLVFTLGAATNVKPGYANFRLDLSQPDKATLKDIDGRTLVGTWIVSADNKRLILDNLNPKPTNTNGIVEYYILNTPDGLTLSLERTAESRKTGNTVNQYALIPAARLFGLNGNHFLEYHQFITNILNVADASDFGVAGVVER